ncbi:hypothetical protein PcaKH35_23280 [Parageobacillus caldoxylosilyticus]|nr:hypothetical protein PcaKH35_23280 [Parageobacillus caldoxylosilyticus]
MASSTRFLVSSLTLPALRKTRDTVAVDTLANFATSLILTIVTIPFIILEAIRKTTFYVIDYICYHFMRYIWALLFFFKKRSADPLERRRA